LSGVLLSGLLDPARLFAGCEDFSALLLAVSGGPDSVALMGLAARWRDLAPKKIPLFVATVDHGLREGSAREAAKVGDWAAELGLKHDSLFWQGEKPLKNIQESARDARYALLFARAKQIGAEAVLTAHHADDQWETVVFRLARGSGVAGLGGMARDQRFQGNAAPAESGRLIRPFLHLRKQALVDFCRAEGREFFDDPSNSNPAFARTRLRKLAEPFQSLGFSIEKAQKLSQRARKADEAVDWAAEQCLVRAAISPDGDDYDLRHVEIAPRAVLERFLSRALARVAGQPPQRLDRLESLAEKLDLALRTGQSLRLTLGGCAATLKQDKVLRLRREPQRRRGGSFGRETGA
jgi:tRNA(Ile)-lysidine synthase